MTEEDVAEVYEFLDELGLASYQEVCQAFHMLDEDQLDRQLWWLERRGWISFDDGEILALGESKLQMIDRLAVESGHRLDIDYRAEVTNTQKWRYVISSWELMEFADSFDELVDKLQKSYLELLRSGYDHPAFKYKKPEWAV